MNLKQSLARHGKPKFRSTAAVLSKPGRILDIGIANDSYRECKTVFPGSTYHGLDYQAPGFPLSAGDRFILCNLEDPDRLAALADPYDLIIINHVLEHLRSGEEVFRRLCLMLAPGGVLYAEFPSIRTAYKPKTRATYHFNDDPTHRRFYVLEHLANTAMDAGCKILSCGPTSTPLKDVLAVPRALLGYVRGAGYGPFMLHTLRKIDHVMVQRQPNPQRPAGDR
jgi:trans-aconitate methyltransferase